MLVRNLVLACIVHVQAARHCEHHCCYYDGCGYTDAVAVTMSVLWLWHCELRVDDLSSVALAGQRSYDEL